MAEPKGHYETVGDVQEWVWDENPPTITVPEGEFNPLDPKPEPKPKPKPVTTKTASAAAKKK